MACVPADDAYLIQAFPAVVLLAKEQWLVNVLAAQEGDYTVTLKGADFVADAAVDDTVTSIRDKLLFLLGAQLYAAVGPIGLSGLLVSEVGLGGLDLTVLGPALNTISATLQQGGDTNEANRQFWLDRSLCGLPPCCLFACCPEDYTLMHAALAAHWLLYLGMNNLNGGGGGAAAGDWQSMRLGPASLSRGANAWAAGNPADGDLAKTGPGQLYLQLRTRYVAPFMCV